MSYIDGFVIAVPKENKQKFIEHAKRGDSVFIEHGANRVLECWDDDVRDGKLTDFRRAVQAKEGEAVVFSWIEWPSKATRDTAMAKVMNDPRLNPQSNPMPFDGKRMIFGLDGSDSRPAAYWQRNSWQGPCILAAASRKRRCPCKETARFPEGPPHAMPHVTG